MDYIIGKATESFYNDDDSGDVTDLAQVTADGFDSKITACAPVPNGNEAIYEMLKERVDEGLTVREAVGTFGAAATYREAS